MFNQKSAVMNKQMFLDEFKAILPDSLNHTSIDLDDIETTTLLFTGSQISKMSKRAQDYFDSCSPYLEDMLINIVANKYCIEW